MSDTESDIQNKVTNEFKKHVTRWVEIDDTIREIRAKSKNTPSFRFS